MTNTKKPNHGLGTENSRGIKGILSSIAVTILGPIIVVATLCFAVNFLCEFAGVDFDAFVWIQDFIDNFPAMIQGWIDAIQELLDTTSVVIE